MMVKEAFAPEFFKRLESVCSYDEITTIVINHLEPDHSGALPELMKRAPQAHVYLSSRAPMMFKALLKSTDVTPSAFTLVKTGSSLDLGGRNVLARDDRLSIGVSMPLAVSSGQAVMEVPVALTRGVAEVRSLTLDRNHPVGTACRISA